MFQQGFKLIATVSYFGTNSLLGPCERIIGLLSLQAKFYQNVAFFAISLNFC